MLLQDMIDNDLVEVTNIKPKDWQEALKLAANKLLEHEYIRDEYIDEIIQNVNDNGPYIVIVPGVAMPHAMAESENVLGTAISFTKFNEPVKFGEEADLQAQLFFTLAAKDYDQHLKNVSELSELLMEEGLIEKLLSIDNIDNVKEIINEFN